MKASGIRQDRAAGERLFLVSVYVFIAVFTVFALFPIWLVFINSLADEGAIRANGFQVIPARFSAYAYRYLFSGSQIFSSYRVTVFVTGIGTIGAVLITSMYAYVLAHRKAKYRNIMSFLTYLTMIFGAGIVGFYILIARWLGLKDSVWALILPYLMNPFFAFILVAFFRTVPYELYEAAIIDGANDIFVFFRIMLPIAIPAVATVSLFYAIQYWNDFWLALLFIDDYKLHPLQIMIRQLISKVEATKYIQTSNVAYQESAPAYGIRLATVCVTIGPVVLLYPFIQRYFVKGVTIGALKG
jgi:multiple sugar transport system permease protein/putative aldouronate transport system permease protein